MQCAIETQKSGPYKVKCELFNDRIQVLYEVDPLALNIISLILIHISQCCGQLSWMHTTFVQLQLKHHSSLAWKESIRH